MHFSAPSAILASCLVLSVHALPVTYSVVDVDGGSAAEGVADQPATVYQTVTKSADAEEPEATTVSVSVTIVETKNASASSTNASSSSSSASPLSSSTSSPKASAQASSTQSSSTATATDTLDALSVLQSAKSTFVSSTTSTATAKSTITQAPAVASPSQASHTASEDCEPASVTVTAEVTDVDEQTIVSTQVSTQLSVSTKGETVYMYSTTTVTPAAASTSYYDDGMWHTRYAIKPSASPESEAPAAKDIEAAPKFDKSLLPVQEKQVKTNNSIATNSTSQATNGASHARRQVDRLPPTSPSVAEGTGAPLMFIHPLLPQGTGVAARSLPSGTIVARGLPSGTVAAHGLSSGTIAARSLLSGTVAARGLPSGTVTVRDVPSGIAPAGPMVLEANDQLVAAPIARRATPYSVVSWNETTQG